MDENDEKKITDDLYDQFLAATDILPTIAAFQKLCTNLDINPKNYKTIFSLFKNKLKSWKCQTLFNKLEKKSKHQDYKNKPCARLKVLVIGAGPVGLRTAIEAAFLGAHVCVVEKRDSFSRNNVLHLWPFLIVDLKSIGIKSFFGKFCAGSLDHISIRRLQCILLKISLLLGVEIHIKTSFNDILEPTAGKGWQGSFSPEGSTLNSFEYDAIVGCDGKYNALKFKRKEFRGKLAIAITCNFKNKYTSEEARVEEISGVAFIYNQEFFQELKDTTGIELENIVYYKDETHYFVMTAKKRSLLNNKVIKQDCKDVFKLLSADNVNHNALLKYARSAADFATKGHMPHHDFATNHSGKEDVAMFDFTSIHQAECASKIIERKGKRILLAIAGDVLLEPFWPTGSGCARGFLSAFDAAWMIRGLGLGRESLDLLQERESIFNILPQTKPDSLIRFHDKYSIDPGTRYSNLNSRVLKKEQVQHLLDMSNVKFSLSNSMEKSSKTEQQSKPIKVSKKEEVEPEIEDSDALLKWCQLQTDEYPKVKITDMTHSWKNGLGFCAIINRYRPDLIDYFTLDFDDVEGNCEKAFLAAEEHLGIPPKISSHDLVNQRVPDKLAILAYVSAYYEALKNETPVSRKSSNQIKDGERVNPLKSKATKMSILTRLSKRTKSKKKSRLTRKSNKDKENKVLVNGDGVSLKSFEKSPLNDTMSSTDHSGLSSNDTSPIKKTFPGTPIDLSSLVSKTPETDRKKIVQLNNQKNLSATTGENKYKRISQLAESVFGDTIVQKNSTPLMAQKKTSVEPLSESEKCSFCNRKVYVMERQSAEGLFFHRTCFRCTVCKCQLHLGNYVYDVVDDSETEGKFYCKVDFNQMIYKKPKEKVELKVTPDKKKQRPLTQVIDSKDISKLFINNNQDTAPSPKFTRPVKDIQEKLKTNLPGLELRKTKSNVVDLKRTKVVARDLTDGDTEEGPYDKLSAKNLLDRHPSLMKCAPTTQKVTTKSFFTASKFSTSTPNLTKLIQEDSMFEEERKRQAMKYSSSPKKKLVPYNSTAPSEDKSVKTSLKKKLSVPSNLIAAVYGENNNESKDSTKDTYGSEQYRDRFASYNVIPDDSIGAVHRRPETERRAQYPVSMAFTDSAVAAGFRPLSVDIDLDGPVFDNDNVKDVNIPVEDPRGGKPAKKKKLKLRKKKDKKQQADTIPEGDETQLSPVKPTKQPSPVKSTKQASPIKQSVTPKIVIPDIHDEPFVFVKKDLPKPPEEEDDLSDTSSSSDEDAHDQKEHKSFFKKTLGGKKKKKGLTAEEQKMQDQKQKRRDKRQIRKELREREMKRLWEAQSIQRKLNEVDVKQFELEEKAVLIEKDLRDESLPANKMNDLMLEWIHLVNEKNLLLRFESELVIQSNSVQLEDRQARLEQQVRDLLTAERPKANSHVEIDRLTKELVDTVEQRNALVEMLEEDRLREVEEDKNIKETFAKKSHALGMDRLI